LRTFRSRRRALLAGAPALLFLLLSSARPAAAAGEITLGEAVRTAMAGHPKVAAFPLEKEAADGRIRQAARRPNPEIEAEIENVWGTLPFLARSETTIAWSQPVEIGKRAPRVRRAEAERATLERDQQSVRLDLIAGIMRAFVSLQGAQQKLALAREAESLASSLREVAAERVAAGAISPIEATRAEVALSLAKADGIRAARDVETAMRTLSGAMGEPNPTFSSAAGTLPELLDVPDADLLVARMRGNPDLLRWDTEREARKAALEVEESLARPDVTLRGGVKYLPEPVDTTFLLGFSVPVALFDRNEGAVREARARLSAVDLERREADVRLRERLRVRLAEMAAAAAEVSTLKSGALAGAQGAYDAVNEGYRLGKFRYLDVLDAGKTLLEARVRHVDALLELNLARVDVERLVAQLPAGGAERRPVPAEGRK
jgi:cobalt-zinc-cadmium efflux system outer membrane protein